jgi:nucleotide-binding universal stress UspA family protein
MSISAYSRRRYRIVVALDGSEYAEIVLEHALDQAVRHTAPDLHFITVCGPGESIDDVKSRLASLVTEGIHTFFGDRTDWRARLHVGAGEPADEIVSLAADVRADLVVVGQYGVHGSTPMGSVTARVVASSPYPTLVIGFGESGPSVGERMQCPACVQMRDESDGEHWFCPDHVAAEGIRGFTTMLPYSGSWTGGTLMS